MELFVSRMSQWPILLVVTSRPEFDPAWGGEPHAAKIELKPIEPGDAEFLVKCVPGAEGFSDEVVRDIAARADGVPLFIEELTKAVVESGSAGRAGEAVPHRCARHSLESARVADGTSRPSRQDKRSGQGRCGDSDGNLRSISCTQVCRSTQPTNCKTHFNGLVQAELVSPSGSSAQAFTFRHALIQDAAYGMLPRDERKALHERIAIALENRFPEIIAAQPEIAADHFTKAGLVEPAIRYWTEAGNRAVRGSALIDAAKHFSEAIRLVQTLPPLLRAIKPNWGCIWRWAP